MDLDDVSEFSSRDEQQRKNYMQATVNKQIKGLQKDYTIELAEIINEFK